jgi:hypothetical protein
VADGEGATVLQNARNYLANITGSHTKRHLLSFDVIVSFVVTMFYNK